VRPRVLQNQLLERAAPPPEEQVNEAALVFACKMMGDI